MVEWSITVVLKTTVPRGTGGSNPSLSAKSSATAGLFFAFKGGIRNLVLSLINITLVLRGLNGHHTVGRGW